MTARSIATVSLSGALDEKLQAIAAAGFDAIALRRHPGDPRAGSSVGIPDRMLGVRLAPNARGPSSL